MRDEAPGDYLDVISPDEIRLKGHRIWLEHVVARAQRGMSVAEIVADLPSLTPRDVEAALSYVEAHRGEVDAYMARRAAYLAERERDDAPSPVMERLLRLRDSLKAGGAREASAGPAEARGRASSSMSTSRGRSSPPSTGSTRR